MSAGEHLDKLLADLKAAAARQALRGQIVWVYAVRDNQRVRVPHIGVPGQGLVELTAEQINALKEIPNV